MKEIPKIVIEEAKRQELEEVAAFLGKHNGSDIYCLGVDKKEDWLPAPPNTPVLVAVKDDKLTVLDSDESWDLAISLCES